VSDQYGGARPAPKKVTVPDLVAMKRDGKRITDDEHSFKMKDSELLALQRSLAQQGAS
jgi:hypothetical protein